MILTICRSFQGISKESGIYAQALHLTHVTQSIMVAPETHSNSISK